MGGNAANFFKTQTIGVSTDLIVKIDLEGTNTVSMPFPSGYTYDCFIDWGDGTSPVYVDAYNSANITHTYATPGDGIFTITVSGICEGFTPTTNAFHQQLIDVLQWGQVFKKINLTSCGRLTNVSAVDVLDLSEITSMESFFNSCGGLITINNLNDWDVSNITNMQNCFRNCTSFNQDLGNWNVEKVTDMTSMFYFCYDFNGNISGWNPFRCKEFNAMFSRNYDFNQPIGNWNVSAATRLDYMFDDCTSFNQPLNWTIRPAGCNMIEMLDGASSFNQNLGFINISGATNMANIARGTALSTANYDATLSAWSQLTPKSNISFGVGTTQYTIANSQAARDILTGTYNWNISDGGGI